MREMLIGVPIVALTFVLVWLEPVLTMAIAGTVGIIVLGYLIVTFFANN